MKQHRFKANGLSLNCVDYGGAGKPALLFIHGGSAHAHWWDFIAPAFIDDFHALALDQRGHGESEWAEEWAYGSRHYVADLDAVIDQWNFGPPILVGHSMGAHNVLVYAAAHAEKLRGMIAIDSPPDYSQMSVDYLRKYAERPARRFGSLDEAVANFKVLPRETLAEKEILEHIARKTFKQVDDGAWIHKIDRRTMIREPLTVWESLHRITCPALLIKITRSPLLRVDQARKMVGAMPQGQLAQIDDSYHHVMLDNPRALIATMREFLTALK
jgi:pimeloyl-ACP methyl ester carboxylesterase